jgi:anthranilate synthase component 1
LKKFKLKTAYRSRLADTQTPVSIFLKLRDKFANSILLESSDYHGSENSVSYICCQPIAGIEIAKGTINLDYPDGTKEKLVATGESVIPALIEFAGSFETQYSDQKFTGNGLFGYMGYDAVQYYEDVALDNASDFDIPEILYRVYRYVIGIDHFKNQMHVFEHRLESDGNSELDQLITLIDNKNFSDYYFKSKGEEISNYSDEEFLDLISKGRQHCLRGDVFQIVLSRRFKTSYSGDDFNVYRALRSINPSPYLFYFDYGNFRVFGSSPEAQIVIKDNRAVIHPIAGTFARTGNDQADSELAQKLFTDTKENSEHVMLVDLARNDLSRNSSEVQVDTFKEIQYFSHVIHLVSKVSGVLTEDTSPVRVVADTFPAGTLSGAPKHMAMTLIEKYENVARGYYGGAIGFMGFNGDFNHAIMIRSFLSENNTLYYQAGAGVVAKSVIESELQEVNNKLAALRQAMQLAQEI